MTSIVEWPRPHPALQGAVTMEDEVDVTQTDGSIASKKAPVPMVNLRWAATYPVSM